MNSKTLIRVILVLIVIVIGFYLIKRTIFPKRVEKEAVFLGVEGYGDLTKGENLDHSLISKFKFNFYIDGEKKTLLLNNGKEVKEGVYTFDLQNQLQEGYIYDIVIDKDIVESVKLLDNDKKAMISGKVNDVEQDKFIQVGEEKIIKIQESKRQLSENLLESKDGEKVLFEMSDKELMELLS